MEEIIEVAANLRFRNELWVLIIPLVMMAIDIVTGLIKAWVEKNFQSKVMRAGLAKKAGECLILALGELLSYGLMVPDVVMNCVSLYIIFMEFMSIIENLDKLGVPVPKFVRDVINNVDEQIQNGDLQIEDKEKKE